MYTTGKYYMECFYDTLQYVLVNAAAVLATVEVHFYL